MGTIYSSQKIVPPGATPRVAIILHKLGELIDEFFLDCGSFEVIVREEFNLSESRKVCRARQFSGNYAAISCGTNNFIRIKTGDEVHEQLGIFQVWSIG